MSTPSPPDAAPPRAPIGAERAAFSLVVLLGMPMVLGSWWALLPGAAIGLLFVLRTAKEDRILREELPGYTEYARHVGYRLVPGIW